MSGRPTPMSGGRRPMSTSCFSRARVGFIHLGLRPLQDHFERRQVQVELQETHGYREGRDVRRGLRRPQREVEAILGAIRKGGLFAVDVDIVPTQIGKACHVWLPPRPPGK